MISAGSVALALVLGAAPVPAEATPTALFRVRRPKVKPADAAAQRTPVQAQGKALLDGGDPVSAGIEYDNAASQLGDPILYLDAGEAYLLAADTSRDTDLADAAKERAYISLDILYFHLDSSADKNFRLVEATEIPALIVRAQTLIEDADTMLEAIAEEERLAAEPPTQTDDEPKKKRKPGRAAKIAGFTMVGAGAVFLGVGAAGLGLGVRHQQTADRPTVYGDEYDDVEAKGKRANLMALIGLPTGAALIGVGVTVLVLSARKNKKKGGDKYSVVPTFDRRGSGGMAVVGRF